MSQRAALARAHPLHRADLQHRLVAQPHVLQQPQLLRLLQHGARLLRGWVTAMRCRASQPAARAVQALPGPERPRCSPGYWLGIAAPSPHPIPHPASSDIPLFLPPAPSTHHSWPTPHNSCPIPTPIPHPIPHPAQVPPHSTPVFYPLQPTSTTPHSMSFGQWWVTKCTNFYLRLRSNNLMLFNPLSTLLLTNYCDCSWMWKTC